MDDIYKKESQVNCDCAGGTHTCIDRRLSCWESWMKDRKKVHKVLGNKLKRLPGELIMNAAEELRNVNEEKKVLRLTRILTPPDPQRGSPAFWNLPNSLLNKFCPKYPELFAQMTNELKCELPEIEHIRLPIQILEEKNVLPRTRNVHQLWSNNRYRKLKERQLQEKINRIEPHRPDTKGLIIIGASTAGEISEVNSLQTVTEKCSEESKLGNEDETRRGEELSCPLLINDTVIPPDKSTTFLIDFDHDITDNVKVSAGYLKLENRGEFSIKLYWQPSKSYKLFSELSPIKNNNTFFFDKNVLVILPQQTIEFPFWFKARRMSTYTETWILNSKPHLWPDTVHVSVRLIGVSYFTHLETHCENITARLNDNVRQNLIKDTVAEIVHGVIKAKPTASVYKYDKAEIFESTNTFDDPYYDRPLYSYNKEVVEQMREIYSQVRPQSYPEEWNYSIENLRMLIIQYELSIDKKSNTSDNENTGEELSLGNKLEELVKHVKTPSIWINIDKDIYDKIYSILCSYFAKICNEIELCEEMLGMDKLMSIEKKHHLLHLSKQEPQRLIYQQFDDTSFEEERRSHIPVKEFAKQQPSPERLKDIPKINFQNVYNAYHNLPLVLPDDNKKKDKKEKGGKKIGKKKDKKDKRDKKGKKAKKGKKEKIKGAQPKGKIPDDGFVVTENFDPFEDIEGNQKHSILSKTHKEDPPDGAEAEAASALNLGVYEQFQYNIYIIFYTNLCSAVSAIEETLEMLKETRMSCLAVKRLEECHKWRSRSNKTSIINIRNLLEQAAANKKSREQMEQGTMSDERIAIGEILKYHSISDKPISYPRIFYKANPTWFVEMANKSTESLAGGKIDLNWQDFKDVNLQTSNRELGRDDDEVTDDVVAKIEYLKSETSVEKLQIKESVGCQKNLDDYVSDEEHFYP